MATDDSRRLAETRSFFGPRAAGWEDRFPDDGPRYEKAVDALAPAPGGIAVDVGCGTGRALRWLREAVGDAGLVVGVDVTPEMLAEAARRRRGGPTASLLLADAERLPIPSQTVDAVFAAGLLPHLAEPRAGLAELARVCRPGGRLAVFHPIGRATLAARHGRRPSDDDLLAPDRLARLLDDTGWTAAGIDDGPERYLALAVRRGDAPLRPGPIS
jgi:SAM-dependent methyltransferase